eukprot:gb/GECG01013187.1/.p1 GENE.gb/GECG01013187.1/~~gb/GECG01013187.1/.p1  ORF type:complete len:1218 (+),score=164.11 gb/GECG01013187.1/:1-3654(+)
MSTSSSTSGSSSSDTEDDWDGEEGITPPRGSHPGPTSSREAVNKTAPGQTAKSQGATTTAMSSSASFVSSDRYPDGRKKLKGVVFDDSRNIYRANRWIAVVNCGKNQGNVELARCSTAVSAAICHDYAQRALFGGRAEVNFPEGVPLLKAFRAYGRPHRNLILQGYLNETDTNEVIQQGKEALLMSVRLPTTTASSTTETDTPALKISSTKGTIGGSLTQDSSAGSNASASQRASDGGDSLWALASQQSQRTMQPSPTQTSSTAVQSNMSSQRPLTSQVSPQIVARQGTSTQHGFSSPHSSGEYAALSKPTSADSAVSARASSVPSNTSTRFPHSRTERSSAGAKTVAVTSSVLPTCVTRSSVTTAAAYQGQVSTSNTGGAKKRPTAAGSNTDNTAAKPGSGANIPTGTRRSKRQRVEPRRYREAPAGRSSESESSDDSESEEESTPSGSGAAEQQSGSKQGLIKHQRSTARTFGTVVLQVKGPECLGTAGGIKRTAATASVFRGVTFCPRFRKCWLAQVYIDNSLKLIGYFTTEEAAANAYDNYLRKMVKSVAVNFPRQGEECVLPRSAILDGLEAKRSTQRKLIEEYPSYFNREDPAIVATEFLYRCSTEMPEDEKWYIQLPPALRGRDFDELLTKLENNAAVVTRTNEPFQVALRETDESYGEIPVLRSKISAPADTEQRDGHKPAPPKTGDSGTVKNGTKQGSTLPSRGQLKEENGDTPAVTNKFNRTYMCRMQVTAEDVSEIGSDVLPLNYEHSAAAKEYMHIKRMGSSLASVSSETESKKRVTPQENAPLHRNFFPHAVAHPSRNSSTSSEQQFAFVYSPFHNYLAASEPRKGVDELRMPIGYGPYDPITENGFGASPTYSKLPPRPWTLLPSQAENLTRARQKNSKSNDFVGTKRKICQATKERSWYAAVERSGVTRWLGPFKTEEQAAQAFDVASLLTQGTNARTNFSYDMHTFFRQELDAAAKEIVPLENPVDRYYDQLKDHKVSRLEACQLQLATDVYPTANDDPAGSQDQSSRCSAGVTILPSTKDVNECTAREAIDYFRRLYRALRYFIINKKPYIGVSLREDDFKNQSLWKAEGISTKYFKSAKIAALAVDVHRLERYGEKGTFNYSETSRQQLLESSSSMQVDHPGLDLIDERVVGATVANYAHKLIDKINAAGYKSLWQEIANCELTDPQATEVFPDRAPTAATTEWASDDGCYNDGTIKRV